MMKTLGVYSLLILFAVGGVAAQDFSIEEKYDRTFAATESSSVEIRNKYGEIIVNTWYKDSVRVFVRVAATGKSRDDINSEMRRVDVELRKIGNLITGFTSFDQGRSRGFFGELMSQVSDVSQTMLGSKKISVDYEIWLPADMPLTIENKFGDVYMANMTNQVNLDLSHGDLRGNEITGSFNLNQSFGKFRFDHLAKASMTLRGVEGKINRAELLTVESGSSELELGEIQDMQVNSRNDKYHFDRISTLIGEGSFTDFNVDYFLGEMQLNCNYGEVFLSQIDKDFDKIGITGKSTDINLILNQASYINTRIIGEEENMILPNSMLVMKKGDIDEEGRIALAGYVGNTNSSFSTLDLDLRSGDLIISIKETDIFTNRN